MMRTLGLDVGAATVKAVLCEDDVVLWRGYQPHHTRRAETVLDVLARLEAESGLQPGRDRLFFTGAGAGLIAPLVGGRVVQEVLAIAAAVEKLHPDVRFVSEIGAEDMMTISFAGSEARKGRRIQAQSVVSGGAGAFIEETARRLRLLPEALARIPHDRHAPLKASPEWGHLAEADPDALLASGVTAEQILPGLFEAIVSRNLAALPNGETPMPRVLLLGGPNCFLKGLQQAWRHRLGLLWQERGVQLPQGATPETLVTVPEDALHYGAVGCAAVAGTEPPESGRYLGSTTLRWWVEQGQHAAMTRASAAEATPPPTG
jgi:activator of 2-hydroxyglutaryl-CoA dehydratase